MKTKSIIYARVSSQRQVDEGHGLQGQIKRCQDFAKAQGYSIVSIFRDEGVSGGVTARPGMQSLLQYLEDHRTTDCFYVVLIDDIKRLARDIQGHFDLKTAIYSRQARIESPSHRFEDTPEAKFVETVLAGAAELERNQNKKQVINRMASRLENGFWPFNPPPGLTNKKHPIYGKSLANDLPLANIYKEAIEKFANGSLQTLEDVRQSILKNYAVNGIQRILSISGTRRILTQILYTGWLEYTPWKVPLRKAGHEGFISMDIFNLVQARLRTKSKPWSRKDYRLDFPLKPYILCSKCNKPLTASWTKGRSKYYPNYWCKTQGCKAHYKTVRKEAIEAEFEALLSQVKPDAGLLELASAVFNDRWQSKSKDHKTQTQLLQTQLINTDKQIQSYLDRISKTSDETLIAVYEKEIKKLSLRKQLIEQQLATDYYTEKDFETASRVVLNALANPVVMWQSQDYSDKRTIILMYFENNLRYTLKQGFETKSLGYPINLIGSLNTRVNRDVETPILKSGLKQ